ncbi:MAG: FRG domain-containing protein [Thermoguttaceae bacterium]|jgi:hypothetical protein
MCAYQVVKHVECKTAGDFIDAISPFGPHFRRFPPEHAWIFRGHGDDNYKLVPSALREKNINNLHQLARSDSLIANKPDLNISQWLAENRIICEFFSSADNSGRDLPEDSQILRSKLFETFRKLQSLSKGIIDGTTTGIPADLFWPPLEVLSLVAMAQHHGLLTRLLDWSQSSYKAAYFAAIDALNLKEKNEPSKQMAVWAIQPGNIFKKSFLCKEEGSYCKIYPVTVPHAANPNLHAQDGLFTICGRNNESVNSKVDRRPMDIIVNSEDYTHSDTDAQIFYHFTVPSNEAECVLWYLNKHRVNASTLFPNFDGSARAVREQLLQRAPHNP